MSQNSTVLTVSSSSDCMYLSMNESYHAMTQASIFIKKSFWTYLHLGSEGFLTRVQVLTLDLILDFLIVRFNHSLFVNLGSMFTEC